MTTIRSISDAPHACSGSATPMRDLGVGDVDNVGVNTGRRRFSIRRSAVALTIGAAGLLVAPQSSTAIGPGGSPSVIVCDPGTDATADCDGVTVDLMTPDYGRGLVPIKPARLYDTRVTDDRLAAGGVITIDAAGVGDVSSNATAVMVNIAVVAPDGPGHVTAYPCEQTRPTTAAVTHDPGETRSGTTLVHLDAGGQLCVWSRTAADIVVDVQGYIAESTSPTTFNPVRVFDSRDSKPVVGKTEFDVSGWTALGSFVDLGAAGDLSGVWLNVSAFRAPAPGYITVDSTSSFDLTGQTARLNYQAGRMQTNLIFAPLDDGTFDLYASASTDVTIDVVAVSRHPDAFVPTARTRLLDTRDGDAATRLQPGVPVEIDVARRFAPATPTAVMLNLAVVDPSGPTHLTAYPCDSAAPTVSNANARPGVVISNAALVPVGADGKVCITSAAATDLVVDVAAMTTTEPVGVGACFRTSTPTEWDTIHGGAPPYTLTGTLPDGVTAEYIDGTFQIVPPDDSGLTLNRELTITDAAGNSIPLEVKWNGTRQGPTVCNPVT